MLISLKRSDWRRYFAGQALAGIIADEPEAYRSREDMARAAINYADALLAELERREASETTCQPTLK